MGQKYVSGRAKLTQERNTVTRKNSKRNSSFQYRRLLKMEKEWGEEVKKRGGREN